MAQKEPRENIQTHLVDVSESEVLQKDEVFKKILWKIPNVSREWLTNYENQKIIESETFEVVVGDQVLEL